MFGAVAAPCDPRGEAAARSAHEALRAVRDVGWLALVGAGVDGAVELVFRQLAFDVGA
jgi:hypothetical protein